MKLLIIAFLWQAVSPFALAKDVDSNVNLFDLYASESSTLTPRQIGDLNNQAIFDLENVQINFGGSVSGQGKPPVRAVSPRIAQLVIDSIEKNPITAMNRYSHYNQPGVDLGFCFGRATYVHLLLLRLGVDKQAIRKVWAMGPMRAGSVDWAYHVAVAVKATTGEWLILDNVPGKLLSVRKWVDFLSQLNRGHNNLRIYTSEPARFGTGPGRYTRANFGLDFDRQNDWYRHYFFDLMKWFQEINLSQLGLS
jgi:hypothetical protein